jgi:hypothetical protein
MDWASIPSDHARIATTVSIIAAAIVIQHFWRRPFEAHVYMRWSISWAWYLA